VVGVELPVAVPPAVEQALGVRVLAAYLAPGTLLTAAALGILAVAAAPLLLTRRVQRMDIPATLRVLE
jgi:hypothetical protein